MKIKLRAGSFLLALLFAFMFVQTASAETTVAGSSETSDSSAAEEPSDSVKSFTILNKGSGYSMAEEPDSAVFWEYPTLPAGQQREGTLKVVNQSDKTEIFSLASIDLPYTDDEALLYLASLHITVSQAGGDVLYDGLYSGIADDNGLKIDQLTLQPGESQEYHITMRCAFNYSGDPAQTSSRITWRVKASSTSTVSSHVISIAVKVIVIIAAIALLSMGVALALLQRKRSHKRIHR